MNNLNIHNIVSVQLSDAKENALDDGSCYATRILTIRFKGFGDTEQKFEISLFSDDIDNILIQDDTLIELQADNEAEWMAELNAGYAKDRM